MGFIGDLQVVTTSNYNTLADSHTTDHTTMNLLRVLSLVFASRFLATDLSLQITMKPFLVQSPWTAGPPEFGPLLQFCSLIFLGTDSRL
jgi:hypothetical protein